MDYWLYTEVTSVMADALELSTLDRMVFALTYSVKSPVILFLKAPWLFFNAVRFDIVTVKPEFKFLLNQSPFWHPCFYEVTPSYFLIGIILSLHLKPLVV